MTTKEDSDILAPRENLGKKQPQFSGLTRSLLGHSSDLQSPMAATMLTSGVAVRLDALSLGNFEAMIMGAK